MNIEELFEAGKTVNQTLSRLSDDYDVMILLPKLSVVLNELGHMMEKFTQDMIQVKERGDNCYLGEGDEQAYIDQFKRAFMQKEKIKTVFVETYYDEE